MVRHEPVRRSADDAAEPRRKRPDDPAPAPAQRILALQRGAGNQAVQRLLQRQFDPDFRFGSGQAETTTISTQDELNHAVETVIEEDLGGHRDLFMKNTIASSPGQWRDLVFSYMQGRYELDGLDRAQALAAIGWVKDKYRGETLTHLATVHVYWAEDGAPYSVQNLKDRLEEAGAYLDDDDDDALEAIFSTEGKFAKTKVEVAPGNLELTDGDDIVVIMDDHQQKHQRSQIPQFKAYTGDPGTKFSAGKDLAWHRGATEPVVRATIAEAVRTGKVTPKTTYAPPKDAIDGIIYDLGIGYDEDTGKYVGSYHCNPVKDE